MAGSNPSAGGALLHCPHQGADKSGRAMADRMSTVLPLAAPDGDVPLDLQAALGAIYEEAAYDLSVDYSQPPPPPAFSEAEANWIQAQAQR